MPSRDVNQCVFKEGRRRCRKNGTGNPPLCNAHRIVLRDQLVPEHAAEPTLGDLLSNVLNGGKLDIEQAAQLFTGWVMGGGGHFGTVPPIDQRPQRPSTDPRVRPAAPWHPPPPPKPPDPLELKRKAAKVVLGFAPNDELDEARIRRRQRELAMRHHPDRGGSVAKMAKINDAVDVLLG